MTFKPEYITLIDSMGDDLRVANSARVSFAKESEWEGEEVIKTIQTPYGEAHSYRNILSQKDTKLINYLAEHNHFTPFTHCMVTLRIKMPFAIRTEWYRHTVGFTRNEISRRYVSTTPEFFEPQIRVVHPDKKQGSLDELLDLSIIDEDTGNVLGWEIESHRVATVNLYNKLIKNGAAPESARYFLPEETFTEFYETASLAAYARLYGLRKQPDAQKEIQQYAECVGEIMEGLFPVSWKALTERIWK